MKRARPVLGAGIAVAVLTVVLVSTWQASVPFIAPSEVSAAHDGQRIQVEGVIESMTPSQDGVTFELSDGAAAVTVSYRYGASRPLALETGRVVVAKGIYHAGVLDAHQVSIRAHEGDGQQE